MMYIKLFEEINFNSNKVNYKKYVDKSTLYIYDFILDNLEFRVQFLNVSGDLNNQNTWVRSYSSKKSSGKYNYELVNKKPIEILSSIQYITEIFIKEVNPNCVIIEHINNNIKYHTSILPAVIPKTIQTPGRTHMTHNNITMPTNA